MGTWGYGTHWGWGMIGVRNLEVYHIGEIIIKPTGTDEMTRGVSVERNEMRIHSFGLGLDIAKETEKEQPYRQEENRCHQF